MSECSVCGGKNVEVKVMPERDWLDSGTPDYQCTDERACTERYDAETEQSGWLY